MGFVWCCCLLGIPLLVTTSNAQQLVPLNVGEEFVVQAAQSSENVELLGSWEAVQASSPLSLATAFVKGTRTTGADGVVFSARVTSGLYEISLWFPNTASLVERCPVVISTGTGTLLEIVNVDMSSGGSAWVSLGTFQLDEQSVAKVSVSTMFSTSISFVAVDAVKFARVATTATASQTQSISGTASKSRSASRSASPLPQSPSASPSPSPSFRVVVPLHQAGDEFVLDSSAANDMVVVLGTWSVSQSLQSNNGSYLSGTAASGAGSVVFNMPLPRDSAHYSVYLTYPALANCDTAVPLVVSIGSQSAATARVDMTQNGNQWLLLGGFDSPNPTTATAMQEFDLHVIISTSGTTGVVVADAVRVVREAPTPSASVSPSRSGTSSVSGSVTPSSTRSNTPSRTRSKSASVSPSPSPSTSFVIALSPENPLFVLDATLQSSFVTTQGTWQTTSSGSAVEGSMLTGSLAGGAQSISFTFPVKPGKIAVSIWVVASAQNSNAVPVSVLADGVSSTTLVDMTQGTMQWVTVSPLVDVQQSPLVVTVGTLGTTARVVVDALKLVYMGPSATPSPSMPSTSPSPTGSPPPFITSWNSQLLTLNIGQQAVIDGDGSPRTLIVVFGTWSTVANDARAYNGNFRLGSAAGGAVFFSFKLPFGAGLYRVSLWVVPDAVTQSSSVSVQLLDDKGSNTMVSVNMQTGDPGWREVGTLELIGLQPGYVTINSAGSNLFVMADSVLVERVEPSTPTPTPTHAPTFSGGTPTPSVVQGARLELDLQIALQSLGVAQWKDDQAVQQAVINALAATAGVDASSVSITTTFDDSGLATFTLLAESNAQLSSMQTSLSDQTTLATNLNAELLKVGAQFSLQTAIVARVVAIESQVSASATVSPSVSQSPSVAAGSSGGSSGVDTIVIVIVVVGVVVGALAICWLCHQRSAKKRRKPDEFSLGEIGAIDMKAHKSSDDNSKGVSRSKVGAVATTDLEGPNKQSKAKTVSAASSTTSIPKPSAPEVTLTATAMPAPAKDKSVEVEMGVLSASKARASNDSGSQKDGQIPKPPPKASSSSTSTSTTKLHADETTQSVADVNMTQSITSEIPRPPPKRVQISNDVGASSKDVGASSKDVGASHNTATTTVSSKSLPSTSSNKSLQGATPATDPNPTTTATTTTTTTTTTNTNNSAPTSSTTSISAVASRYQSYDQSKLRDLRQSGSDVSSEDGDNFVPYGEE